MIVFAAGHLVQPIEEDDPAAQLIALVTAPQHQGTGVGQVLVEHFEAWVLAAGARRSLVSSGDHRVETRAYYLRRLARYTRYKGDGPLVVCSELPCRSARSELDDFAGFFGRGLIDTSATADV